MKFVTIIPFMVWIYSAFLVLFFMMDGLDGLVLCVALLLILQPGGFILSLAILIWWLMVGPIG